MGSEFKIDACLGSQDIKQKQREAAEVVPVAQCEHRGKPGTRHKGWKEAEGFWTLK